MYIPTPKYLGIVLTVNGCPLPFGSVSYCGPSQTACKTGLIVDPELTPLPFNMCVWFGIFKASNVTL